MHLRSVLRGHGRSALCALVAGLVATSAFVVSTAPVRADSYHLQIGSEQIAGPDRPDDAGSWLAAMKQWRTDEHARIGYDDANYERPELAWAQHNPIQPQVMVEDRKLYDPKAHRYTVDKYLADVDKRYGGVDSVLIWPTYPNIGVDNRNTEDMLRDMPGGLSGVRRMV